MRGALEMLPAADSFAATYLDRRQGIKAEHCFLLHEETPDAFGSRRVEAVIAGAACFFIEYYVVGTRESDPSILGRIERKDEGYVASGGTSLVNATHYDELHFVAKDGGLTVSVKGTQAFSVPLANASDLLETVRKEVRDLLRPREARPPPHKDNQLSTQAPNILIDGSNIARMATMWGTIGGRNFGRIEPLLAVKNHLLRKGYFPLIVYDSSLRNDKTMDTIRLDSEVAPIPPHTRAHSTMEADQYLLEVAETFDPSKPLDKWFVVSNDAFRDHEKAFPGVELDRRLVTVSWTGATPVFTVVGSKNYHHTRNPTAAPRQILPRAGPPVQ